MWLYAIDCFFPDRRLSPQGTAPFRAAPPAWASLHLSPGPSASISRGGQNRFCPRRSRRGPPWRTNRRQRGADHSTRPSKRRQARPWLRKPKSAAARGARASDETSRGGRRGRRRPHGISRERGVGLPLTRRSAPAPARGGAARPGAEKAPCSVRGRSPAAAPVRRWAKRVSCLYGWSSGLSSRSRVPHRRCAALGLACYIRG